MDANGNSNTPNDKVAIMVLKTYQDRVCRALLQKDPVDVLNMTSETLASNSNPQTLVIHETIESGPRHDRQGYRILLIHGISINHILKLSPMARCNISFAWELTNHVEIADEHSDAQLLLEAIHGGLVRKDFRTDERCLLRVNVYPKNLTESMCLGLQRIFKKHCGDSNSDINLTKSASKCTHWVNIVSDGGKQGKAVSYYWGVFSRTCNSEHTKLPLNDMAKQEIVVEPSNHDTGEEYPKTLQKYENGAVNPSVPLSRAYYKLDQVWREFLEPVGAQLGFGDEHLGTGIDLGAAPGGWIQVLIHGFRLPKVVAVDPAHVANRLRDLECIVHEACSLEDFDFRKHAPYRALVCDASEIYMDLWPKLEKIFSSHGKGLFDLPCTWVVTLKLPFKTTNSILRHEEGIERSIGERLHHYAKLSYSKEVEISYKVVHLMANSNSERTLIAVFR